MNISHKIMNNGTIVGYMVQDGSFTLPMCKNALYTELYIQGLIDAGYKFYSREADTIEDKDGQPICNLPSVELNTLDEIEWNASLDMAMSSALSDAEAAKYYSFKETSAIEFKREDTYEINTRERFIAYLEGLKRAFYNVDYSTDNRPINSFINPDVLFTIDELNNNPELKAYMDIIIKRHHFRDYSAYRKLVRWLCDKGVLNTTEPSVAEFIKAYYAWGPEGINDKCTNIELKLNVDGAFTFPGDPLTTSSPEANMFDNRTNKVVVIDDRNNIHFLKTHEDISNITDISEFGRNRILIGSNNTLFQLKRDTNVGKKYRAVKNALYSDVSDRLCFTLISESGFTYLYKVAHNKMRINLLHTSSTQNVFAASNNFTISSIIPSIALPFDMIRSQQDYYLWNLAIVKSSELVRAKSLKAPVNSTSEFLINDGINPIAIVDTMAHSLGNGSHKVNKRYMLNDKSDVGMQNALDLYCREIPEYILQTFNLTEEDLENGILSFLELADVDDLKDRRDNMLNGSIVPGDPGFDETFKDFTTKVGKQSAEMQIAKSLVGGNAMLIDAVDYYTKLKFVYDSIFGGISVNNFGDGKLADVGASYMVAAECILSVAYAEFGSNVDAAANFIENIETSNLIDVNKIFKYRDKAYKGYMVDFAQYRKLRACENTWIWAYCTKVFREISNAPIEQQRPYLMELVTLSNDKRDMPTRKLMSACVKQAIDKADLDETPFSTDGTLDSWNERKCAEHSVDYIAAQLFFYILAGGVKTEPINGVYKVKMNMFDANDLEIDIPVEVYNFVKAFNKETHKKYITVYDYCKYEYNPYTSCGTYTMCLVNADIDPWHVKPKKGYSIKSYSLLPNYYDQTTLDNANGVGFYQGAYNTGAIAVQPLKTLYKNNFIPTSDMSEVIMYEDMVRTSNTIDDLIPFMDKDQYEYIFAYVRRWALERKRAIANGKKLVSIPLKQDIIWNCLSPLYCGDFVSTEPVYESEYFDDKRAQTVSDVRSISWRDFVSTNTPEIETLQVSVKEFNIHDFDALTLTNHPEILSGEFEVNLPITITGNYINIKTDTLFRVPVSKLTVNDIESFERDGVLKKLNDTCYFIKAINGDFVLEVGK